MKARLQAAVDAWNTTHPTANLVLRWTEEGPDPDTLVLPGPLGSAAEVLRALPPFELGTAHGDHFEADIIWAGTRGLQSGLAFDFVENYGSERFDRYYAEGFPDLPPHEARRFRAELVDDASGLLDTLAAQPPFRYLGGRDCSSEEWWLRFDPARAEPEVWCDLSDVCNLQVGLGAFFERVFADLGWLLDGYDRLRGRAPPFAARLTALAALPPVDV